MIPVYSDNNAAKTTLGYTCALTVSVSAVVTITSGQLLGNNIPKFECNFVRFALQLMCSSLLLLIQRKDPCFSIQNTTAIALLFVSSLVVFWAGVFFILALLYLPAAVIDGLFENVVIILASVMAIFTRNCNPMLPLSVITCVCGNLLLFQPEFLFKTVENAEKPLSLFQVNQTEHATTSLCNITSADNGSHHCMDSHKYDIPDDPLLGFMYAVALGFCFWMHGNVTTPYLLQYLQVDVIFFWVSVGCILPATVTMYFDQDLIIPTDIGDITLLLLLSFSLIAGMYLVMRSVIYISPTHSSLILPLAIVLLFAVQKTILKDIHPGPGNSLEIVGLIMIVLSCLLPPVYDLVLNARRNKQQAYEANEDTVIEVTINKNSNNYGAI